MTSLFNATSCAFDVSSFRARAGQASFCSHFVLNFRIDLVCLFFWVYFRHTAATTTTTTTTTTATTTTTTTTTAAAAAATTTSTAITTTNTASLLR